jgi:hypothetical protein
MFGKRVTHRFAEVVLQAMGRASSESADVVIVAFVMPLDDLEFRGLAWASGLASKRAPP